jgi:hypothetical protein
MPERSAICRYDQPSSRNGHLQVDSSLLSVVLRD